MAEENQTGADGQQEPEQRTPAPKDVNNAKPRTFTQEEVDRIINERLGRERGRKSDYEELKEKAGQTADLEIETLQGARGEREAQKRSQTGRTREGALHDTRQRRGQTRHHDPSVLAGDDEKQIGEYAEKLMKVFADMRSRGTVADQSARTGQAKTKHSSRETSSTP